MRRTPARGREALLFYCQHSLGLGHLVRSFALAEALAEPFDVTITSGGVVPSWLEPPAGVDVVALPPLGADSEGQLVSRDPAVDVVTAKRERAQRLLSVFESARPGVVLVELFPFGRKKFAGELLALLRAAHALPRRPVIASSLRDILVSSRRDQARHDRRASWLANRYFDAILVHSDPRVARLEESFDPRIALQVPVHHTGFVLPRDRADEGGKGGPERGVVVSAGGGLVGGPLLRAGIEAHRLRWPVHRVPTTVVAGPFLPEPEWRSLQELARGAEGLELLRSVPRLSQLLFRAVASVSQCGYNTALDLLSARVPALVVPFADGREDEQLRRARRLEELGAVRVLEASALGGAALARALDVLVSFRPGRVDLELHGAERTATILHGLVRGEATALEGVA